jgi:hypothetical protein
MIIFTFFWHDSLVDTFAEDIKKQSPKMLEGFNFVAAGDFGCGDEPNRTVSGMMKKNPENCNSAW